MLQSEYEAVALPHRYNRATLPISSAKFLSVTQPASNRRSRRLWRVTLALAVAATLGIGVLAYWKRVAPPVPPFPVPESLEPAVAKAVYAGRERVLSEPRSAAAWGELGEIFLANELEDEAYSCFQHADRLEPGTGRWAYLVAIVLINRGDRDAALPFLQRAVESGLG